MSEALGAAVPAPGAVSAGGLLRQARERQGLHIAALAASIKVAPKKLEMLEADRYDALPDATFTRALAQTVCRALKIDPATVLRLLPPPSGHRLEQVGEGLNAPFRDRPSALVQRDWGALAGSPAFWITALILAAAVAVYFLPSGLLVPGASRPQPASSSAAFVPAPARPVAPGPSTLARAAEDAAAPTFVAAPTMALPGEADAASTATAATAATAAVTPLASATVTPNASASAAGVDATVAPTGIVQVRTTAPSWLEISDAKGRPLVGRLLRAGEAVGFDGTPPLRVRIGNAAATRLVFRGQPIEVAAYTRDNVARLELK